MRVFAERLKKIRKENGLSVAELSKKINISAATISRWEKDLSVANFKKVKQLALFFKVSTDYLCGLED